jgi:hypothetical protein
MHQMFFTKYNLQICSVLSFHLAKVAHLIRDGTPEQSGQVHNPQPSKIISG